MKQPTSVSTSRSLKIALTGATGYVGGMLLGPLSEIASEIVCISRNPDRLQGTLPNNATVVAADVLDRRRLQLALENCDVAYYLVHSLAENTDFIQTETRSAQTFADAARGAGVQRIIYLGALAQSNVNDTSAHIESRHRVGQILKSTGIPVTEFQSSVVIGAGSMPFEVIRSLVERLPVMVTPRWVRMPVQPISASDLVRYLVTAAAEVGDSSHVYEIGGSEVTTYAELMHEYARARKLKRFMIPVPAVTPRLSSLWLKLVTPAHYRIGRRIVDSAAHSSITADQQALSDFKFEPVGVRAAIANALNDEDEELGFLDKPLSSNSMTEKILSGTKFIERRSIEVGGDGAAANEILQHIGGANGWLWGDWLWKLRGAIDRIVGGPGMRSGQTTFPPTEGSILDFWTVVRVTDNKLVLRADMKLPGEAWLSLSTRDVSGKTFVDQIAAFSPKGVFGLLYWFALYPVHVFVFRGMLKGIKHSVEEHG